MRKGYFIYRVWIAALAVTLVSLVSCERHLDISGEASSVQISVDLPGNMGVEELQVRRRTGLSYTTRKWKA